MSTSPIILVEWGMLHRSAERLANRLVGVPRIELGSRANQALTVYKAAALPLSYTPASSLLSSDYAGIR